MLDPNFLSLVFLPFCKWKKWGKGQAEDNLWEPCGCEKFMKKIWSNIESAAEACVMSQYWKLKDYRGSIKWILPMFFADYAEIILEGALVN